MPSRKKLDYKFKDFPLRNIEPKTENQEQIFEAWNQDKQLVVTGPAGTGKSFILLYLALKDLFNKDLKYEKIYIIRSVVPSRDIGFLPGTLTEKLIPYETPYKDIIDNLLSTKGAYETLKSLGALEFISTSYVRGLTLNNSIIIVDELQNFGFSELDSIITRFGQNCRIAFLGDINQTDLKENNGFYKFTGLILNLKEFVQIYMNTDDIVRSGLVKSYLIEKSKLGY